MSQDPSRPIRARQPQEKQQRRDDILQAAEILWQRTSYTETSMQQIAQEANLAKGTLYLYFNTKEELFIDLLSQRLQEWLDKLYQELVSAAPLTSENCADLLILYAIPQKSLRQLLVLLDTVLLPSLEAEREREIRLRLFQSMKPIVDIFPFQSNISIRVLLHLYALSIGWHLAAQSTSALARIGALSPIEDEEAEFQAEFDLAVRSILSNIFNSTTQNHRAKQPS